MIAVTAAHVDALAAIHAEAFAPAERWHAAAIAGLLATPGTFGLLDERGGFVLARQAGGEAEVLTLAVAPVARRTGVGRRLVTSVLRSVRGPVFLEVAACNGPALALYGALGFLECGRRRCYYGEGRDALILRSGGAAASVAGADGVPSRA